MSAGRCAAEVAAQAPLAPSICVFDVNETLLDIEFVAPLFHRPTRSLALASMSFEQCRLSELQHEIRRRERTQNVYIAKRRIFKVGTRSALR